MSILLKDVMLYGRETSILIEGDRIAGVGAVEESAEHVIDGRGKCALPGLVNTHTHAAMTLMRGYADDLPLQEWLEKHIWPLEANLTEDDVYWGTRLACLEMIRSGTTCFNDMYWHMEGACRAVDDSGIRGFMGGVLIDMFDEGKAEEQIRENERIIPRLRGEFGGRVNLTLGPHALYTVSADSLKWCAEYARENGMLVHFHLSETEREVSDCVKKNGKRPVEYLDGLGFLGPNLVCAHSVWLDDNEIRILAERGVKVSHCPVSNMKLAVGSALRYDDLRNAGVTVSLGTDGCASNNNLDMFESMKFAALLQKMHYNSQTTMPASDALRMATIDGARSLGLNAGAIEEGMLADVILMDLRRPDLTPHHNLESDIVYSTNGSCVDTVICDGRVLMSDGVIEGDVEVMEKASDVAEDLKSR
ncbi:MAG: amidohydrolase [Candidatus Altiarchaeota archaeon]